MSHDTIVKQFSVSNPTTIREYRMSPDGMQIFHSLCKIGDADYTFSRVVNQYDWKRTDLAVNGWLIGKGEDPRAFNLRGVPAAYAVTARQIGAKHPVYQMVPQLFFKDGNVWKSISYTIEGNIAPGKNWGPFVFNEELYFVHEISPMRVLKTRENTASLFFEYPIKSGAVKLDNYPSLRGGCNGLQISQTLVLGFGHTNSTDSGLDQTIHRPYVWIIDMHAKIAQIMKLEFSWDNRFNIIDPTAFLCLGNQYYLMTCETERVWGGNEPQTCRSCLYPVAFLT